MHGKLNSLNWYCGLWRRMEILLSLTQSTGWSCLLCMYQTNFTDYTRRQRWKLGLWSPAFKAEQLIRNFTNLQCVLIINCLQQTVQAAKCCLACLPDTGWNDLKTRLFQTIQSRLHRWPDLEWLSTKGSFPLQPKSFTSNSWAYDVSILK